MTETEKDKPEQSEVSGEIFNLLEKLVQAPALEGDENLKDLHAAMSKIRAAEEARIQEKKDPDQVDPIHSDFIQSCLRANELGDGILFKTLNKDLYVFNSAADRWMIWDHSHWSEDWRGAARMGVEKVVEVYLAEAVRVSAQIKSLDDDEDVKEIDRLKELRKYLNSRAYQLRGGTRAKACMRHAVECDDGLAIKGDEIDQKPFLFPCPNGVVNLRTGELEPGRQEDFLEKCSLVEWDKLDAQSPLWEKTLLEIFSDNQELVDFLQRLLGMTLIGEVIDAVMVVMTGIGRNGKSLIAKVVSNILGPMAGAVRAEMLLDQMRVTSSGPTPDIMALRGLRAAIASETDNGCKVSTARCKWLTGGDELKGRGAHDRFETEFIPTHTLFLLTNHTPHAPADDFAFWERIIVVPFLLSYVRREPKKDHERRADPRLFHKLKEEFPGILAWMVRGSLEYQANGLQIPAEIKKATGDYRRKEDSLADWIEDCCFVDKEDLDLWTPSSDLFSVFEVWWERNISKKVPKQKWFGQMLGQGFTREKRSGVKQYQGIGLNEDPNTMINDMSPG